MRTPIPYVLVLCTCIGVTACDRTSDNARPASPTAPSNAPPAPSLPVYRQPLRLVSGDNGSPVTGARVMVNGDDEFSISDAKGEVVPGTYSSANPGDAIDIEAPGFLPRKTKVPASRLMSLWPVADEAEANAVREMVYRRGQPVDQVLRPVTSDTFYLTVTGSTAAIAEVWNAEAGEFFRMFSLPYTMTGSFQYEVNELEVVFTGQARCAPVPTWGFCRVPSAYRVYQVQPDRVLHRPTIRRVLASLFLGANPLPGVMNVARPLDQLSDFEVRTIRMILERKLPNQWPDTDR